jgi:hypothetical protein
MRVSQEYADQWVTHLIRTGGDTEQAVSARPEWVSHRGNRKPKGPQCGNCGRETEVLFDGFLAPVQMEAAGMIEFRGQTATAEQLRVMCLAFNSSEPARVCQRCRPPSNLEVEEILMGVT